MGRGKEGKREKGMKKGRKEGGREQEERIEGMKSEKIQLHR